MKSNELADLLLQNPDNEVLVKSKWYLSEDIKEVTNTSNNMTAIVPEIKVDE